jgi:peptidyl-prolyl cis-trans isomerase D
MRNRIVRVLFVSFVLFVVVVFAVFFGQRQGTGAGDVAEVDGERIRRDVFEAFREQSERSLAPLVEGLSRAQQRELVDHQTLDGLIRRSVLSREAEGLGLGVTNAELSTEVHANPDFQRDGRFDRALLEGFAASLDLSPTDLLEELRTEAMLRKFERLTTSPVRVSREAARFELARRGSERSLRYATARIADFTARVELPEGAAKALVEKEPARVHAAYEARRAEFQQAEQVHAQHILLAGEDGEARAARVVERLGAGEPFDKLARELSDDPATAQLGGDLGWFPRGIMSSELDAVLFNQLEAGKTSAPVKTERGWHVVRLVEKRAAQERSFSDVAEQLAREILVQEEAARLARESAARVLEAARASKDLNAAAQQEGLGVATTGLFHRTDQTVPELGAIEGLIEMAFALDAAQPVAPELFEKDGQLYAVALGEAREPAASDIDAQLDGETERLTRAERNQSAALWYLARRRELEARGALELFPIYER